MSVGFLVSSVALVLSLLVTAVKCFDWLSHSDPRTILRAGRMVALLLALASLPGLMALLAFQQWTGAMLLGAAMLLAFALVNWRRLLPRRRFRPLWTDEPAPSPPQRYGAPAGAHGPDPELARRAAIVLQDYLALAGRAESPRSLADDAGRADAASFGDGPMSLDEARAVLGLEPGATAPQIRAAHRRLMQLVHPDRGGTDYLAVKINRAKDVLLARATPAGRKPARAARALRPSQDDEDRKGARPAGGA
ncbi:hypothetical protein [Ancylobacter sp.]|uniref:hypothetical protein n=1 Tax=Ancylobacter sp. TaxID=1872567 RepID=UPI003D1102C2